MFSVFELTGTAWRSCRWNNPRLGVGPDMSEKKPQPIYNSQPRKFCPVCGDISYSRTGIHPQCAQEQNDLKRLKRQAASSEATETTDDEAKTNELKAWHKRCPKCHAQVHVRKTTCGCGHSFRSQTG